MERLQDRITEDIIFNKLFEFGKAGLNLVLVIMTANAECYGTVWDNWLTHGNIFKLDYKPMGQYSVEL